jgi:hypothetical protein
LIGYLFGTSSQDNYKSCLMFLDQLIVWLSRWTVHGGNQSDASFPPMLSRLAEALQLSMTARAPVGAAGTGR